MDPKALPFRSTALKDPQTPLLKTLDTVIRKATAEKSEQRYQSTAELRRAIETALESQVEEAAPISTFAPVPFYIRWVWAGVGLAIISIAAMVVYHLADRFSGEPAFLAPQVTQTEPATADNARSLNPKPSRLAPDGRTMVLVRGDQSKPAFYADPSPVTFHHYVEFLNEIADKVAVEEDLVKFKDSILVYIGDGAAAADQIIYQQGRFRLGDAAWAAKPVVRVTWIGAQAYASHYGKRLLTFDQWKRLRGQHSDLFKPKLSPHASTGVDLNAHMEMMAGQSGSIGQPPEVGASVTKEWLRSEDEDADSSSRIVQWPPDGNVHSPLLRHPWEGFSDVGFRTVMDVKVP